MGLHEIANMKCIFIQVHSKMNWYAKLWFFGMVLSYVTPIRLSVQNMTDSTLGMGQRLGNCTFIIVAFISMGLCTVMYEFLVREHMGVFASMLMLLLGIYGLLRYDEYDEPWTHFAFAFTAFISMLAFTTFHMIELWHESVENPAKVSRIDLYGILGLGCIQWIFCVALIASGIWNTQFLFLQEFMYLASFTATYIFIHFRDIVIYPNWVNQIFYSSTHR